jgi:Cof subfamily protein (haloacid dehalogenase superfamily)
VFVDIDGTLIDHNFAYPPSARAAIQGARAKGNLVFLCTGRQRSTISGAILDIGFDGVVSAGGACIEAGNELLLQSFIPESTLRRIVDYLDAHSVPYVLERDAEVTASAALLPYFDRMRGRIAGTAEERRMEAGIDLFTRRLVHGPQDSIYPDVAKIVFPGGISAEQVRAEFADECEVFRGSIPFFGEAGGEISQKGVHKGFAVEFLVKHYGLNKADAIAIGDSDNDRKMLEAAGVGIAMGNADADLQRSADYVTDRLENDGLAKAFEKYKLL